MTVEAAMFKTTRSLKLMKRLLVRRKTNWWRKMMRKCLMAEGMMSSR